MIAFGLAKIGHQYVLFGIAAVVVLSVVNVIGVKEAIRTGTERGMLSFDSALYNLVREGRIELEEALASADSRTNLEAKINFG